ncbi:MAG TPA: hypothetical protein VM469_05565 [Pseudoxanthomonas sp.]|nr:hypothetical protein [Pseudoxanthomonas sp.]
MRNERRSRRLGLAFGIIALGSLTWARAAELPSANGLAEITTWLSDPATEPDLLTVKLAVDHLVDPSIDASATRATIVEMASSFHRMVPSTWAVRAQVDSLLAFLYKPGPWNQYKRFGYDFSNPIRGAPYPINCYPITWQTMPEIAFPCRCCSLFWGNRSV